MNGERDWNIAKLDSYPKGDFLKEKLMEKGMEWKNVQIRGARVKLVGKYSGDKTEDPVYRRHVFDLFSAPATFGAIGAE
jgi:hypothetical protein